MNLSTIKYTLLVSIAVITVFTSCEKDDSTPAKPEITLHELGLENSKVAYVGSDLHIEADIVAEGKIDKITVELHNEDGTGDEIEVEFDSFVGLKNTTFHQHVEIPIGTAAGEYHFHFVVTDLEGNSTSVEEDVMIEELVDETAPVISISSAPTSAQEFVDGEPISISGTVTDNTALAGMVVALVYQDDAIADADVAGDNSKVIVMLHTHNFDNADSHSFTASIAVGAANDNNMEPAAIQGDNAWKSGNYYLLVKCKDAKDNWAISEQYDLTVKL